MSALGQLNISLHLDSVQFQQSLSKSDHQAEKFVKHFVVNMTEAERKAKQFTERTSAYLGNIEQAARNINKNSNFAFWETISGHAKNAIANLIVYADSHTELSNKLKLVTESETQHARAMADVYDISLKTAQSTQATSWSIKHFLKMRNTSKLLSLM